MTALLEKGRPPVLAPQGRVDGFKRRVRTDAEIEEAVGIAFAWDEFVPANRIRVTVSEGCVTLEGQVDNRHDRQYAERIVRLLPGVVDVQNRLHTLAS